MAIEWARARAALSGAPGKFEPRVYDHSGACYAVGTLEMSESGSAMTRTVEAAPLIARGRILDYTEIRWEISSAADGGQRALHWMDE